MNNNIDNKEYQVLRNESGTFHLDNLGIVQRFEPADDNPFIDEETEIKANYIYTTHKSIRTYVEHLAFIKK